MKLFRKEFTFREKITLLIFAIAVVALVYVRLVDTPVRNGLKSAEADKAFYEDQLLVLDAQVAERERMRDELADLETDPVSENGHVWSFMPSYNGETEELDFLNDTLAYAEDYLVSFQNITRKGKQIRRGFSLQFVASSYDKALEILNAIEESDIRCIVGNVSITPTSTDYLKYMYENEYLSYAEDVLQGPVNVNCVATFYETMWDGVADKQLPKDPEAEKAAAEAAAAAAAAALNGAQ